MKPITVLILTHRGPGDSVRLPHLEWLTRTNPQAKIHIVVGEDSPHGREYNWKNGDQPLRKWWRENGKRVDTEQVAIIEWDTLVGCALPSLPDNLDLAGKQIIHEDTSMRGRWEPKAMADKEWTDANWYWWEDAQRIEHLHDKPAVGLISFGMFLCRSWVLNAICDPKWDETYRRSIQNELRFPTVAMLSGAKVGQIVLPFVEFHEVQVPEVNPVAAIYHGVKKPYDGKLY